MKSQPQLLLKLVFLMAEAVGFEPTRHFCPLVFKTSSIGRSDSPPSHKCTREGLVAA